MKGAKIYREIARDLRSRVFSGRWGGDLGSLEKKMPVRALKSVIKNKFNEIGRPLNQVQLSAIAREFPPIDLMPDDVHPYEARILKREVDYIVKVLAWAAPEVATKKAAGRHV